MHCFCRPEEQRRQQVLRRQKSHANPLNWPSQIFLFFKIIFTNLNLFLFFVFQVILPLADVGSDVWSALWYYKKGHEKWSRSIIAFMFLPFLLTFVIEFFTTIIRLLNGNLSKDDCCKSCYKCIERLPVLNHIMHWKALLELKAATKESASYFKKP